MFCASVADGGDQATEQFNPRRERLLLNGSRRRLVESVARAICRDFGRNPDAWADAGVPVWRKYIGNAHNVLAEQDKEDGR